MNLFKRKSKIIKQHELKQIGNGEVESKLIKSENKKIWVTIGVASFVLMVIIVTSCIIDIYDKAYRINEYFGYGVLAVLLLLIFFFIIVPLCKLLFSPSFTLDASKNEKHLNRRNYRTLKSVAKNIIKGNNCVPEIEKEKLKIVMKNRYEL